jgi:hypothetical protein
VVLRPLGLLGLLKQEPDMPKMHVGSKCQLEQDNLPLHESRRSTPPEARPDLREKGRERETIGRNRSDCELTRADLLCSTARPLYVFSVSMD